jgi:hypothetical protein
MQIHAMCIVKNESDIIAQTLAAAVSWCDYIYVWDNGSDDDTWKIVQKLATEHPQIVPFKQEDKPFTDFLRSEIFFAYRHRSSEDDWWCLLGADEFYVTDPRAFLASVPRKYNVVRTAMLSYYFTDRDADLYRSNPGLYGDDVPVQEKCRYYLNHWSESRFFRYAKGLVWQESDGGFPKVTRRTHVYPELIPLQNFSYRSPQQIQTRLRTRRPAVERGEFLHEAIPDWSEVISQIRASGARGIDKFDAQYATEAWEDRVVEASSLDFDAHDGQYNFNEVLMPPIPRRRSAVRSAVAQVRHIGKAVATVRAKSDR